MKNALTFAFYFRSFKTYFVIFALALGVAFPPRGLCKTEDLRVILVVIGGVRTGDFETKNGGYLPRFNKQMVPKGVTFNNLVDLNYQQHMPAVRAAISGRQYNSMGNKGDYLKVPSLFQLLINKFGYDRSAFWMFGELDDAQYMYLKEPDFSKGNAPVQLACCPTGATRPSTHFSSTYKEALPFLKGLLTAEEEKFISRYGEELRGRLEYPNWDSFDDFQFGILKKVILKHQPRGVLYYMPGPESAHYDTYGRYVLSLRSVEEKLLELWSVVQDSPTYRGKTHFIIAVDHTRDKYHMENNQAGMDRRAPVWMYWYGPGVPQGKIVNREVHHVDIFATLQKIYNLDAPNEGKPILEVLGEVLGSEAR